MCSTVNKIWTNFASLYNKIPQWFWSDRHGRYDTFDWGKSMDRSFLFTAWGLSWIFYAQSNPLHAPSSISNFFICSAAWLSEKIHRSRSGEITMKRKGSCFTNLTNGMLRKISYAERPLVGSKTPPARGTQRRFPPKHTENTIYF